MFIASNMVYRYIQVLVEQNCEFAVCSYSGGFIISYYNNSCLKLWKYALEILFFPAFFNGEL